MKQRRASKAAPLPPEPKAAVAKVRQLADSRRPRDTRQPIEFDMTKATASVINSVLQQDVIKAVLGAYIEGKGLEGAWQLQITGARLVPVEPAN